MRIAFILVLLSSVFMSSPSRAEDGEAIIVATKIFVLARDFEALERVSTQYRTSKDRTSDGIWNLEAFYSVFDNPTSLYRTPPNDAVEALQGFIADWLVVYPDSPSAHVAKAMALLRKGWNARGGGTAETVTPEGWRVFRENVRLAGDYLEAHPSQDPQWHAMMIQWAIADGAPGQKFKQIIDAALAAEPTYGWTISNIVKRFLPQWGGDKDILDAAIRYVVAHNVEADRPTIYTRAYWSVASQLVGSRNPFTRERADWDMMKAGFEQIIEAYPTRLNLRAFAQFACIANDLQTAKRLIEVLAPFQVEDADMVGALVSCKFRYMNPK